MKKKLHSLREFYKKHPKRFWALGILVVIIAFVSLSGGKKDTVTVSSVQRTDLKETILATGQVTSQVDLGLSFSASDIVRSVSVDVGNKVYKGQILAQLDNQSEYAALKSAQAKYKKVEEGSSNEEVAVAAAQLASAESDLLNKTRVQDTLVANAYRDLLNTDTTPILESGSSSVTPIITGTYTGTAEGSYTIQLFPTSSNGYFTFSGLETGTGGISTTTPSALGTKGLFIKFPTNYASAASTTWTILLPNTKSANYLTDLNAYEEAKQNRDSVLSAARATVSEKEAELALKKATARPADLEAAEADVLSASVAYENTILRAPANGTITRVDIKIGERAEAQKVVMNLEDVGDLYVEAKINEANIAHVALGQKVTMTLDAFGPTAAFPGTVMHIDPSATTDDGVVNYKIKASIDEGDKEGSVRPGMNANMTILVSETPNVIAVPQAAIEKTDGKSFVNVITNEKRKKYAAREVTTGASGDGNLVEITSGLTEGEKIAIVSKK